MRSKLIVPMLTCVTLLAACGSTGGSTPSPSGPGTPQVGAPTLSEPPLRTTAAGEDAAEDNVCYAQDITVVRAQGGPLKMKRCVKAGVKVTVRLTPDEGFKFGDAHSNNEAVATVATSQLLNKSSEWLVTTVKAGDVAIEATDAHVGDPSGPAGKTFTLTIAVS